MAKIKAANRRKAAKTQFTYFIIKAEEKTYGYDVYADGNLYIHQNTIPGIGGTKGFVDTTSAGEIARLVIQKINQGELPPTISPEELKRKKITHLRSTLGRSCSARAMAFQPCQLSAAARS